MSGQDEVLEPRVMRRAGFIFRNVILIRILARMNTIVKGKRTLAHRQSVVYMGRLLEKYLNRCKTSVR
ncbi:MAG: hypothetical protein LBH75_04005 [Treponema sp.]|jgi:hypothetical protein|nr:hypothetical protein [Treponema sp.]